MAKIEVFWGKTGLPSCRAPFQSETDCVLTIAKHICDGSQKRLPGHQK